MLLVFSYDIDDFVILSNLRLRSALFLKMLSILQCVGNTNPNNPVAILRSRSVKPEIVNRYDLWVLRHKIGGTKVFVNNVQWSDQMM
jgi:hypothetical protein